MSSAITLALNYESIPLSKRLALNGATTQMTKNNITTTDLPSASLTGNIDWGGDLNITDETTGYTPLMAAAMNNNSYTIRVLIDRGADVNFPNPLNGRSALTIASKFGQIDAVNMLCHRGAMVNHTDNDKMTAVMHAAKAGHHAIVVTLLTRGAGINHTDVNGFTAVHFASKQGHTSIVEYLCNSGAAMSVKEHLEGKTPLIFAAQYGRKDTVSLFIAKGVDLNITSGIEEVSALMMAAKEGHKGTVLTLLFGGAKVKLTDIFGWTALHFAASWGRKETSAILISYGRASVDSMVKSRAGDGGGNTPLMIAAKGGQIETINTLLSYGANIDTKNCIDGNSAIAAACKQGASSAVDYFIKQGADVNSYNRDRRTPLMLAAMEGHFDPIVSLLNAYADINILDKNMDSALTLAGLCGKRNVFLKAVLEISGSAKANIIPWIELECPQMLRFSDTGGPAVYLNSLLYGPNGVYAGLLNRPHDCDVYLVHSLVMLAATCKRGGEKYPSDKNNLDIKQESIEKMLSVCMSSRGMTDDVNIGNSLLLNKNSLRAGEFRPQLLAGAFVSGPLALCIENSLTNLLFVPKIELQIHQMFTCCLRDVPQLEGGFGDKSILLRLRYCPAVHFVCEGIFKTFLLLFVTFASDPRTSEQRVASLMFLIFLSLVSFIIYEIGQMEEKRWAVSPSMIFNYQDLEARRLYNVYTHFFSDIWKLLDLITIIVLSYSVYLKFMGTEQDEEARLILSLSAIPITFGLLRYPSGYSQSFGTFVLSVFLHCKNLVNLFILFAFTGLGFGITFSNIFRTDDSVAELNTFADIGASFRTIFDTIFNRFDLKMFDYSDNKNMGIIIMTIFIIWCTGILFNMIIATIVASNPVIYHQAGHLWILIKARHVQQYLLACESSPMAMLPPPFNLFSTALYIPHSFYSWRARLYSKRFYCVSLAGSACDWLLNLIFIVPAAIYEFWCLIIDSNTEWSYRFRAIIFAPLTIVYIIYCLFVTLLRDPLTIIIVKSRLSDGRLRISYGGIRDATECIGVHERSHFKDPHLKEIAKRNKVSDANSSIFIETVHADAEKNRNPSSKGVNTRISPFLKTSMFTPSRLFKSLGFGGASIQDQDDNNTIQTSKSYKIDYDDLDSFADDKFNNDDVIDRVARLEEMNNASKTIDGDNWAKDGDGQQLYEQSMESIDASLTNSGASIAQKIAPKEFIAKSQGSLDFPSNRYAKFFIPVERRNIFEIVLPEFFTDAFTAAINENSDKMGFLNELVLKCVKDLHNETKHQIKDIKEIVMCLLNEEDRLVRDVTI